MGDKIKFEMEFVIQSSPQLLYQYISTPSGLSEWFADNVNSRGEKFTFIWDGAEEVAKLLKRKSDEFVRFAWEETMMMVAFLKCASLLMKLPKMFLFLYLILQKKMKWMKLKCFGKIKFPI